MMKNPRNQNGNLRRKYRARFKAMGAPCALCGKPIMYDQPSDPYHPLSFVIDERIPVSKYWMGGYASAREAAEDWENLQPMHWRCNQIKGNRLNCKIIKNVIQTKEIIQDGEW